MDIAARLATKSAVESGVGRLASTLRARAPSADVTSSRNRVIRSC
jgi:hypothetical protein